MLMRIGRHLTPRWQPRAPGRGCPTRCVGRGTVRPASSNPSKAVFYDMRHSNNAARCRLWLALKEDVAAVVETRTVTYADLQTPEFAAINPLKKVCGRLELNACH